MCQLSAKELSWKTWHAVSHTTKAGLTVMRCGVRSYTAKAGPASAKPITCKSCIRALAYAERKAAEHRDKFMRRFPPGTMEALEMGCTCPFIRPGITDPELADAGAIDAGCPLHGDSV